jgi:hypothetical protein
MEIWSNNWRNFEIEKKKKSENFESKIDVEIKEKFSCFKLSADIATMTSRNFFVMTWS